jgi:hypothetical protein
MSPRVPTKAIPPEAYVNAPAAPDIPVSLDALPVMPVTPAASVPLGGGGGSVRFGRNLAEDSVPPPAEHKTTFARNSTEVQARLALHRKEPSGQLYSCRNHPGVQAELKCDLCGGVFCAACVKETRKRMLCRDCAQPGRRSALLARQAEPERPPTFDERLAGAFLDPLLHERKYLLLGGPLALWLGFVAHWGVGVLVTAFIVLWLLKIVRRTAQKAEEKSTHPMLEYVGDDIAKPFFRVLLALFVLLLPILIYVPLVKWELVRYSADYIGSVFSGDNDAAGAKARDPEHLQSLIVTRLRADRFIPWALLGGALLLPLALGMLGLFARAEVLSPQNLANALTSIGGYYLLILALLAAGFAPTWYVVAVLDEFAGAQGLLCAFLIVYFSMVAFRVFGDLYLTNKGLFQWYGRPLADC